MPGRFCESCSNAFPRGEDLHKELSFQRRNFIKKDRPLGEAACFQRFISYDFSESRRGLLLFGQTADDVLTGDDANEAVQIVHHGNEVVPDDGVQQLVHRGGDADGGILPEDIPDVKPLQLLHGAGAGSSLVGQEPPEKISLADGAHVLALAVDDGDGAAAMVPELLQTLPDGVVVEQVGDAVLRRQKISDIHNEASFLMGRRADPPGS